MNSLLIKQLQSKVALERDEHAYKHLFLYFYKGLTQFAFGIVKTREASEEVVSDVMLKVWTLKEDLTHVTNLKFYLYKATKNTALNYLNSNAKYNFQNIESVNELICFDTSTPEETILRNEWKKEIMTIVERLPPKCQMVYKLIKEDGFTYKEVAVLMDISENTVDRHLSIALHKLIKGMKIYLGLAI